jgi:dihydroorotase
MKSCVITSPLDMHLHVRDGAMMRAVAPLSANHFAGAVIMPNLLPPVNTLERAIAYKNDILEACSAVAFQPYMTLFFRKYTEEELRLAKPLVLGIKLYPAGATTNSEDGVREIEAMYPVLECMEELDIPLLVHGETHGFVMDREREFCDVYRQLATRFPLLRITMEHITTQAALDTLNEFENLRATITAHHLVITLDDVVGGLMNPHLFCKPIAKRPEDRQALLHAALTAHPRVMMGSDSAPHPITNKEAPGCAAGVFTAPLLLSLLAEVFDKHDALPMLQQFISSNAQHLYGVTPPQRTFRLFEQPWTIPERYGTVVPMWAGKTLLWSVEEITV